MLLSRRSSLMLTGHAHAPTAASHTADQTKTKPQTKAMIRNNNMHPTPISFALVKVERKN